MKPTKTKVTEKEVNFLKKLVKWRDDVLVKRIKRSQKEEGEATSVLAADEYFSYMVQTTQLSPVFVEETFGLKNIEEFLKAVSTYGEMEERDNVIIFSSGKKKITYRKQDPATIQPVVLPEIDNKGYVPIPLAKEEIKEVLEGVKNKLSSYASLILTPQNKLMLKIGELSYDNIFEQEIKDVIRKDTTEIKFLTKLEYLDRLFSSLDEDSKVTLFMKVGAPLICVEKGSLTNTKTFIASAIDEDSDEEKIVEVITDEE